MRARAVSVAMTMRKPASALARGMPPTFMPRAPVRTVRGRKTAVRMGQAIDARAEAFGGLADDLVARERGLGLSGGEVFGESDDAVERFAQA